jgi:hypothetical protein
VRKHVSLPFAAVLVTAAAAAAAVPPGDSFNGTITGARGAYNGDNGTVSVAVSVPPPGPRVRSAIFTLAGARCRSVARCIRLSGKVHGTMTVVAGANPDAGKQFAIAASGTVGPLGHVEVSGSAHGTGFIAQGRESLTVTLHGSSGSVTVTAQSRLVRGFTSP